MSDRRKNYFDRRQHADNTCAERREHDDRRLTNRSSHSPKGAETWRLEGRCAKEHSPVSEKLPAVPPAAWTHAEYSGHHCLVGPFSSLEQAKAFSQQPQQQHDYESHFFQLRTAHEYWFVEVASDGQTNIINSPELVSETVYAEASSV